MKLTIREKLMLGILAIVGLIALAYFFVIKPQSEKIAQLTLEAASLEQEVQMVKAELASIDGLEEEIKTMDEELQKKTERFYPRIYQDRFIVLFNKLVSDTGVTCSAITFSEPMLMQVPAQAVQPAQVYPLKDMAESYKTLKEKAEGSMAQNTGDASAAAGTQQAGAQAPQQGVTVTAASETMTVTLQIRASYTRWMSFLKKIETLDRTAIVQNLTLADDDTGILSGNIIVNIYGVPKLQEQDKEYLEWPFNGRYGRTNPFAG